MPFANKDINVINISNILSRKELMTEIPPYFKNKSVYMVPIVTQTQLNVFLFL